LTINLITYGKYSILQEKERFQFVDFEFGDKPIFSYSLGCFKDVFLSKYPHIDRKYRCNGKNYIDRYLYKPGQKRAVRRLLRLEGILRRCKHGYGKWVEYARKIGRLYGYSTKEIEGFIKKCQK